MTVTCPPIITQLETTEKHPAAHRMHCNESSALSKRSKRRYQMTLPINESSTTLEATWKPCSRGLRRPWRRCFS